MVNTPDHKSVNVPVGNLCLLDDIDEPPDESYPNNTSASSNSSSSFDIPPDASPPVPPRVVNAAPLPKNQTGSQTVEPLLMIDSNNMATLPPPIPNKPKTFDPLSSTSKRSSSAMSFENNFVHTDSFSSAKNVSTVRGTPPLIKPPPALAQIAKSACTEPEVGVSVGQFRVSFVLNNKQQLEHFVQFYYRYFLSINISVMLYVAFVLIFNCQLYRVLCQFIFIFFQQTNLFPILRIHWMQA